MRLAGNGALRVTQKTINDEGQRQHHQRIQLESSNRVQVQQLMKSARRPAARTLQTGQRTKGTLREKTNLSRIKDEEQDSHGRETQPNGSRNRELATPISSHVNKMKVSHDRKTAAHSLRPEPLRK